MTDTHDSRPSRPHDLTADGPGGGLTAEITRNGIGQVKLALGGELALDTSDRFRAALGELEGDGRYSRLVVDLSGLSFMDSTGIRGLLGLREAAQRERFELVLVRAAPSVHRVLEITQLAQRFTIVDDPAALG